MHVLEANGFQREMCIRDRAGGALAFANNMTAPVIAANELAAEKETLKEIYPDVSDDAFVKVKDNASKTIEKIFEAVSYTHLDVYKRQIQVFLVKIL